MTIIRTVHEYDIDDGVNVLDALRVNKLHDKNGVHIPYLTVQTLQYNAINLYPKNSLSIRTATEYALDAIRDLVEQFKGYPVAERCDMLRELVKNITRVDDRLIVLNCVIWKACKHDAQAAMLRVLLVDSNYRIMDVYGKLPLYGGVSMFQPDHYKADAIPDIKSIILDNLSKLSPESLLLVCKHIVMYVVRADFLHDFVCTSAAQVDVLVAIYSTIERADRYKYQTPVSKDVISKLRSKGIYIGMREYQFLIDELTSSTEKHVEILQSIKDVHAAEIKSLHDAHAAEQAVTQKRIDILEDTVQSLHAHMNFKSTTLASR